MDKQFNERVWHEVYKVDQNFAEDFSTFINGKCCSKKDTADMLARDHRYLVSEKFKLFMLFVERLADDYKKGLYDGRNEWSCRCANEIISHMSEAGLYFPNLG